jgi:tetratricopeptide (TPR) repeat protein
MAAGLRVKSEFHVVSHHTGHPLKTALAIVALSALLSACASLSPTSKTADASPVEKSGSAVATEVADNAERSVDIPPVEGLPSVALTEDIVFKFLSSEIAFQRGNWQFAYVNMLAMAQETRDPRLARRAAEMAVTAKRPEEALAAVRLWREVAPKSDEATQFYLGMLLQRENLNEVQQVFEQRLRDVRPQSRGLLLLQIQRLLLRAKDKAAAFAVLEKISQPYLQLPEAHIALAQSAFTNNDPVRARSEAQLGLKAAPSSEIAVLTLAQVIADKKESAQVLQTFLTRYPANRDVRLAFGRMLIEQRQYDAARNEFNVLLKTQPDDLTTLFALGILGTQTNDLPSAEKYLNKYLTVLAAHPDETRDASQALIVLAQIAEDRKDNAAALRYLDKVGPGDAYLGAQIKRAQLIARGGDVTAAEALLHDLDVDGTREPALLIQAEAQIQRDANQPQRAYQTLEAGIKRFPDSVDLLYDFAMAAEKIDKIDKMESALRQVIKLAPTNQNAYNALGYSLAERNIRLPEAAKLIEQAMALAPEDPFIMDSMGWVQFRLGKLVEAEALLRRAYALKPDVEIAVHLGEVLWVRGQKEDAKKFWSDARSKDPKNDSLKSTLTRLQVPQ